MASDTQIRQALRDPDSKIGFVMSSRIGDSLVSMVLIHNLIRSGRAVQVYGNHIHTLRRWFPDTPIQRTPDCVTKDTFAAHDVMLHFRPTDVLPGTHDHHDCTVVLDDFPEHRRPLTSMVRVHQEVCGTLLGICEPVIQTGLVVPETLADADPRRIILHPTAGDRRREWLPVRFANLAARLHDQGWRPEFVTTADEIEGTGWIEDHRLTRHVSSSLDALAERLAGSAGFVGNDSGVAHLASCVGRPFVSLHIRRKVAIRWRPGWTEGCALTPVVPLLLKPLKERFWAAATTLRQVSAAVDRVFGTPPTETL